ncbi:adenylosuccinate lyase [Gallalistipes aquisgranensis]|uniref:adenylosuccinate lyase n=1 Tax=Gallalistipes aquisgranensis TaxID=2779358 RepID=UPI001CF8DD48|nr:adenylosuccinate lyase [Gallalistipes aquisgranensis]MBE5032510.1 adenylosuccinate lyase [Gallalistipes aquisgranensis]
MELSKITAISPVDGRYRASAEPLDNYFSEFALIRYRVLVEIEYFIALCDIPLPQLEGVDPSLFEKLRDIYRDFTVEEALRVKEIEKTTNHDVKAVEYFIKEKMDTLELSGVKEFVHFGLTSQDINNTAIPLSLKDATHRVYYPQLEELVAKLSSLATEWENIPLLAHTHGQPASPTKLGKEIRVFVERLEKQMALLRRIPAPAKFGGATGNFNAHMAAYPEIDWVAFANRFVNDILHLDRSQTTTQIEHYDNMAAIFDGFKRINTILIDFCRDMWTYISMEYFKQKIKAGEVGSSAMPHKVNPIDFENAEGNLGMANAIFQHLSAKLPVSRMQRDLTDSTTLRNIGVPAAHTLIALKSILKGLGKLIINTEAISQDLDRNWAVVAEGIQTILRREQYPAPYEALKALTRTNKPVTKEDIGQFIDQLDVKPSVKEELHRLTPQTYTGIY